MKQMSLTLEPGIGSRTRSLREHLATRIYQQGLTFVAGKLDSSPSKLTEKLAGMDSSGKVRGMSVDELEHYIQATKDVSPIHYLVDKYLQDPEIVQQEAAAKFAELMEQLLPLAHAAGFVAAAAKKARR
jgi:hypothetical protein